METSFDLQPAQAVLATVAAGLQSLFSVERTALMTGAQSLALVVELLRLDARL